MAAEPSWPQRSSLPRKLPDPCEGGGFDEPGGVPLRPPRGSCACLGFGEVQDDEVSAPVTAERGWCGERARHGCWLHHGSQPRGGHGGILLATGGTQGGTQGGSGAGRAGEGGWGAVRHHGQEHSGGHKQH